MPDPFEGFEEFRDEWTNGKPFTLDPFALTPIRLYMPFFVNGITISELAGYNQNRAELMKEALQQIHKWHLNPNKPE